MDSKLLLVIATLALAATSFMMFNKQDASDMTVAFENFKNKHGKLYASEEEEAYRFALYI